MTIDITKINSTPIQAGERAQNKQSGQAAPSEEKSQTVSTTDTVELTERVQQLQKLQQKIADLPDVNADKVEALKQQIADGSYSIDANNLAGKIVDLESA